MIKLFIIWYIECPVLQFFASSFPFKNRRLVSLHLNQCDHTHCQSGIRGRTVPVTGTGKELKNWHHSKNVKSSTFGRIFGLGCVCVCVVSVWVWNFVKLHDMLVCLVVTWYHDIIFRDMHYCKHIQECTLWSMSRDLARKKHFTRMRLPPNCQTWTLWRSNEDSNGPPKRAIKSH